VERIVSLLFFKAKEASSNSTSQDGKAISKVDNNEVSDEMDTPQPSMSELPKFVTFH